MLRVLRCQGAWRTLLVHSVVRMLLVHSVLYWVAVCGVVGYCGGAFMLGFLLDPCSPYKHVAAFRNVAGHSISNLKFC